MKRGIILLEPDEVNILLRLLKENEVFAHFIQKLETPGSVTSGVQFDQESVSLILDCFTPELLQQSKYNSLHKKLLEF